MLPTDSLNFFLLQPNQILDGNSNVLLQYPNLRSASVVSQEAATYEQPWPLKKSLALKPAKSGKDASLKKQSKKETFEIKRLISEEQPSWFQSDVVAMKEQPAVQQESLFMISNLARLNEPVYYPMCAAETSEYYHTNQEQFENVTADPSNPAYHQNMHEQAYQSAANSRAQQQTDESAAIAFPAATAGFNSSEEPTATYNTQQEGHFAHFEQNQGNEEEWGQCKTVWPNAEVVSNYQAANSYFDNNNHHLSFPMLFNQA
ncbi:hypothetical protein Ciccas_005731 [Cichlidogyrus casuarinus]|uniref:Uncharacterized protein n=1 Tax=Cichlidogyrus casuarinus TaxID=1844966 RepID=A0ABD2QBH1_9PLAT